MKTTKVKLNLYTANDTATMERLTQILFPAGAEDGGFDAIEKGASRLPNPPTPHLIYLTILNSMHNYPPSQIEFAHLKSTNVSHGASSLSCPSHLSCPLLEISEM